MIISIDGPAASGKSITAKLLSKKMGYIHLNSGLIYRAFTYVFLKKYIGINLSRFWRSIYLFITYTFRGSKL